MHTRRNAATLGLALMTMLVIGGCAASQKKLATQAALGITGAVAQVDDQERSLFASGVISIDKHKQLNAPILKALRAARAFDVAVLNWPNGAATPATVLAAKADIDQAVQDALALVGVSAPVSPLQKDLSAVTTAVAAIITAHLGGA